MSKECILCGSKSKRVSFGLVSPWISEISGQEWPQSTTLLNCTNCEFTYFEKRFSNDELFALYSDYRSDDYYRTRKSWEPWYRRKVNDAYADGSAELDERVVFMTSILQKANITQCSNVVDVGGDEGQFFPNIEIQNRYVIELSDKPLRKNVRRIKSLEDLDAGVDLIVAAHVAEHVNDPVEFFRNLINHLDLGGHLYVEVPLDRPLVRDFHATRKYDSFLRKSAIKKKKLFITLDFMSGVARQFGLYIPRFGVVKQSEHLNYFNIVSLVLLLQSLGVTTLESKSLANAKVGGLRMGRLGVLAVKE
jgi:SAM-dependent methyltransferase